MLGAPNRCLQCRTDYKIQNGLQQVPKLIKVSRKGSIGRVFAKYLLNKRKEKHYTFTCCFLLAFSCFLQLVTCYYPHATCYLLLVTLHMLVASCFLLLVTFYLLLIFCSLLLVSCSFPPASCYLLLDTIYLLLASKNYILYAQLRILLLTQGGWPGGWLGG